MNGQIPKLSAFKHTIFGRIGVIDIGSNSVRLVVFDGATRSPSYFFNEKVLCGLGKGLRHRNILNREGKKRTLTAIERFMAITKHMQLTDLIGVATAAIRNAEDGKAFVELIRQKTSLNIFIASGEEEARLSANGVLLGYPDANGIACDIGGGSLELADIQDGHVKTCCTGLLGSLFLSDFEGSECELDKLITKSISNLKANFVGSREIIYFVGGSCRAFARIDMLKSSYPLKVLHEYKISAEQMVSTAYWIMNSSVSTLSSMVDTSVERLSLLPLTCRVLIQVIRSFEPKEVYFSSYGLREGILYDQMPETVRNLNPLIEACRYQERSTARFPGFGEDLFKWILPVFEKSSKLELDLYYAACLLHDTSWRAHPDYRAEVCFESVTRANFGGIDHNGRLFLALALMTRYKNTQSEGANKSFSILSEDMSKRAIILGQVIRLGAMISGNSAKNLYASRLTRTKNIVILAVDRSKKNLIGEPVRKRFFALVKTIGVEGKIIIND